MSSDLYFSYKYFHNRDMKRFRNNPWIAAVLNFFIPGLGYVYAGKKVVFSTILLIGMILYVFWVISLPDMQQTLDTIWLNASLFFIMLGFAVDGYQEVKKSKKASNH